MIGSSSVGCAGAHAVLEGEDRRHLEGVLVRIHLVVRAVDQRGLDVDHRIAGEHALVDRLVDALLHRRDEFLRHPAALDAVDEFVALAGLRLELQPDVAVLAAAARLLDELALHLERLLERLAVGHLRLADRGLDAEFALHAVDDDLQVQLAHAGDDGLARFLVGMHAERRVFLRQAAQRHAHLLLVDLGLRLHRLRNDRLREHHALERDRLLHVADGLAGNHVLEADHRGDVAGAHFLDFLALVGVHLQQAADALLAAASSRSAPCRPRRARPNTRG